MYGKRNCEDPYSSFYHWVVRGTRLSKGCSAQVSADHVTSDQSDECNRATDMYIKHILHHPPH